MGSYKLIYENMSNHYESLLASGKRSDVVLVAGDKEIRAHKVILSARSPVFAAIFAHTSTKESMESRVEIIDLDMEVLEALVRYIYTGKVDMLDQYAADLFVAADKYQLDRLKSICKERLLSQITTESVSDILIFADMYQATELNTEDLVLKCLDYITNNVTQVMDSDGWKKIVLSSDLMTKLYEHLHMKYSKEIYAKKKFELKEEQFNVALVVGDTCLLVHKHVLSAPSPVFGAMFAHESVKKKNQVKIPDIDVEVLKLLIKYIYTGRVERLGINAAGKLLVAADKYQLNGLKSICKQELLCKIITIESFSSLLIYADMFQITELYNKCLNYITNNATQVIASVGWKTIVPKFDLLAKIFEHLNLDISEQLHLCPINVESVLNLFILADIHQITELTSKCVEYIIDNGTEVMQQADWKKIVAKPDLLAKIFERLHLNFSKQQLLFPITVEFVSNLFILADIHHFTELTTKCVEYITDNVTEVMKQADWKNVVVKADLVALLFEHLSMKYTQVLAAKYGARGKPYFRTMSNKLVVHRRF